MMSVFPFAVITWDLDAVLGIFGPLVTSIAVLLAGLLLKQRIRSFGVSLLVVGAAGVVLSTAWIALGFYIDSHVK